MVLFDHQIFIYQRYGGISKMFSEILQNLYDSEHKFILPVDRTENENLGHRNYFHGTYIRESTFLPPAENWLIPMSFPGKGRLYRAYNRFSQIANSKKRRNIDEKSKASVLKIIEADKVLVFHPTYYNDYYFTEIDKNRKMKLVLTIFDLIYERFIGYFPPDDIVLRNRFKLMNRADKIIAISESTKNDIIDIYGIPTEKIQVVYLAGNLQSPKPTKLLPYFKDYILYVGVRWLYKNFRNFLRSVAPLIKKYKCFLICAGSQEFNHDELELMEDLGIRGKVIHYRFADDVELASLYANARIFVFPSLYEGFGIPLLEAMSQGCPVVCSNTSSFPEVVGNAAEIFDPWNVESMTHSIQKVFESDSIRKNLIDNGRKRSQEFSWEKCGWEHVGVYEELSGKRVATSEN